MTRWYRAYEGTVTDAKLGEVALVAGCSRSVAIATWHAILEGCASTNDGGRFDTTPRRIAVILGEPVGTVESVFAELCALGMIDGNVATAWAARQFESDNSNERVKRYRDNRANNGLPRSLDLSALFGEVSRRDGRQCIYCLSTENLCVDHLTPVRQGGTDDVDNLGLACKRCNSGKAGRTPSQAGYEIKVSSAAAAYQRFLTRSAAVTGTDVTVTLTPPYTESDTESEKKERDTRKRALLERLESDFARFWEPWPHKVGKDDAKRAFAKVANELDAILAGLQTYIRDKPPDRPWLNPATFLNRRRWEDKPAGVGAKPFVAAEPSIFISIDSPAWEACRLRWDREIGKGVKLRGYAGRTSFGEKGADFPTSWPETIAPMLPAAPLGPSSDGRRSDLAAMIKDLGRQMKI